MSRISSSALVLMTLALTAGCNTPEHTSDVQHPAAEDVDVVVATVAAITDRYEAVGSVRARTTSELAARAPGEVTRILVDEGDVVRAGQVLIEIDPREGRAQVERASAEYDETLHAIRAAEAARNSAAAAADVARVTYERFSRLRERGSISEQEYDEAEARHRAAAAELQRAASTHQQLLARRGTLRAVVTTARVHDSFSRIASPIAGVVTRRSVDVGDQAMPGATLLVIEGDGFEVDAVVEEQLAGSVKQGDDAHVMLSPDRIVVGRVRQVSPSLDAATRSYRVTIDLPGEPAPRGTFVRIAFAAGDRQGLLVPSEAVRQQGQLAFVWTVDRTGFVRMRVVSAGKRRNEQTEILSGLSSGDKVIIGRTVKVREGQLVNPRRQNDFASTAARAGDQS